ncbi:MAG: hypothetical protein LBB48_09750 [Treponema sp.]|jgi:hypothetical protein|nr:hypothetical protein [Treponema sp.]
MGEGIGKARLRDFDGIGAKAGRGIRPAQREMFDLEYGYGDAVESGYGVFFFTQNGIYIKMH